MHSDDIPSITILGLEDSSDPVAQPVTNFPGFLSPLSPVRNTDDASSLTISLPSPTLSTRSSVHFSDQTHSKILEDSSSHSRRPSFTSTISTIPDPHDTGTSGSVPRLQPQRTSDSGLSTITGSNLSADRLSKKKAKKGKNSDEETETRTAHELELDQDRDTDPSPFLYRPYQLAHMLGSKNFNTLGDFGGTIGLIRGLGTHSDTGLSKNALAINSGAVAYFAQTVATEKAKALAEKKSMKKKEKGAGDDVSQTQNLGRVVHEVPLPLLDEDAAINGSVDDRRRVYGPNILPTRPSKSLLQLMWLALKDKVLVLLSIAAVISLALGLFQDFGTPRHEGEPPVDWVEGVAIMVAIAIVVVVGSLNDWQKERQFKTLNEKKEERGVKVIRDGVEQVIDIKEVVVGDVALLEPGEIIPCDGVFLSGHSVKCDESSATGESDSIKKISYEEHLELVKGTAGSTHADCFVISGSKVLEGVGRYVVVAVGTKSYNGRIIAALRGDPENTPLQLKLNDLAELIAKVGFTAGVILFLALLIRFSVQLGTNNPVRTANEKGIAFVNILIISVTLIVVAVPEGLPLAVTLALAFATKRMTYEKLLVRVLGSCETMANASVICTDKTGTLTQNVMSVVAGSIGIHAKFVRHLEANGARSNADGRDHPDADIKDLELERKHGRDFSIDQAQLNTVIPPPLRSLFNEAIAINSTAFEDKDQETGEPVLVGNKTETALLQFAKELGWRDFKETRRAAEVVQVIPFSSNRKAMGVVIKVGGGRGYRAYLKGASEILSRKCERHVVVRAPTGTGENKEGREGDEVETKAIDALAEENISRTIIFYANQTLRTIALCYRDFETWPPVGVELREGEEVSFETLAQNLTLIGIVGIEDPLREGVRDAVAKCLHAGVSVKMCTGDNVLTARSIATQCGIFTPGGIIMEGPVFRRLTRAEMIEITPRLQVLARSSPEDKKILVETLKSIGEVVGVTGDGTNDGPALKTAHVGFSMGIAGTEVAKEASDIILMDDNFSSIVKAIMWGRCVNDAVRKFLQFQLSTNVTSVVITFVSAVASNEEQSVISAVQLLWINIIMDTFAALALATDPATEASLDRKPDKKTAPLFSTDMYKQILCQSIYQIVIILIFHFLGFRILGFHTTGDLIVDKHLHTVVQTLVFNTFVFAQIFNSVNCRRLDRKLNIFEGILKNRYFIAITLIEIVVQILIVFVGGAAFQVTPIGGREWGISLALGIVSIPLGALIRLMSNEPFEKLFRYIGLLGKPEALPTTSHEASEAWIGAVQVVRDNLGTFANLRGGRLRSSSFVIKSRLSRRELLEPINVQSLMTMVPSLIAGTIATGQKITQTGSLSDPARHGPSKSSAALWEGKLQLHPDTPHDDPAYIRYAAGNQSHS